MLPIIPELNEKINRLVTELVSSDIELEKEYFGSMIFNYDTKLSNQNVYLYTFQKIYKKIIEENDADIIKEFPSTNDFPFILGDFLLNKIIDNMKIALPILKDSLLNNNFHGKSELSHFQVTADELIEYLFAIYGLKNKSTNILVNRLILSVRVIYVELVCSHSIEQSSISRNDLNISFIKKYIYLYNLIYTELFDKELVKNDMFFKIKNCLGNITEDLANSIGDLLISFFNTLFIKNFKVQTLTKKSNVFFTEIYYHVYDNEKEHYNGLTESDVQKLVLNEYSQTPRLSPPVKWTDNGTNVLNKNFSGGSNLNKQIKITPIFQNHNQNNHSVVMYNHRVLESLNMVQSCAFLINRDFYNWIYSSDNSEYIPEDVFKTKLEELTLIKKKESDLNLFNKTNEKKFREISEEIPNITKKKKFLSSEDAIRLDLLRNTLKTLTFETKEQLLDLKSKLYETISTYYSQNLMKENLDRLYINYKEVCYKINGVKEIFPFPEEPLIYFPTGLDFRLRLASRSGIHPFSVLRVLLISPWHYPLFLRDFIPSLMNRYLPKALSYTDSLSLYNTDFNVILDSNQENLFVKKANDQLAFKVALMENQNYLKFKEKFPT